MSETFEEVAARLGITPATLESRILKARAAIQRKTGAASFPPGYERGAHVLARDPFTRRLVFLSIKPRKGRPSAQPPLAKALDEYERATLKAINAECGRLPRPRTGSIAAGKARTAKAAATKAEVITLTDEGRSPHFIAYRLGITQRRVRQIQQAAKVGNHRKP
jgi:hypothetical protein